MFLMQDQRQSKFLLHRIIERQMEEEHTLINVQEGMHRPTYIRYSMCIICIFITICFAIAGILFINYLFAKKIWL
jgi:hypothetical protein